MTIERPSEEIKAGDVVSYFGGGLMLVTVPGEAEQIQYVGRRVTHHGVTLTLPEGYEGKAYQVGEPQTRMDKPRTPVTVYERRKFSEPDPCICRHCNERRGGTGAGVVPPVVDEPLTWPMVQPDHRAAYGYEAMGKLPQAWAGMLSIVAQGCVHTVDGEWRQADRRGNAAKPRSARALGALLALGLIREVPELTPVKTAAGKRHGRAVVLTAVALERYRALKIDLPASAREAAARHEPEPEHSRSTEARAVEGSPMRPAVEAAPVDGGAAAVDDERQDQEPAAAGGPKEWDPEVAEREEIAQARRSVAFALASRVAMALGEGWRAEPFRGFGVDGGAVIHTDGRRIEITEDGSGTHVQAGVKYPSGNAVELFDAHKPVTRFKSDRPARQLVNAIRTKLLPVYNRTYPEVVKALGDSRRRDAGEQSFADRIAAYVPSAEVTRYEPSPWVEAHPGRVGGGGSIEKCKVQLLGSGEHIVEFKYVDPETLEALMQAYGAMVKAKQARSA